MNKAEQIIQKLELTKHPEGGYYKEVYRSNELIKKEHLPERFCGARNFGTAIYFLLKGDEVSALHKVKQDEIWHFYDGSPLVLHTISENGEYQKQILGTNLANNERPQLVVLHNTWMAAEVCDENSFTFVGCTTAPGFDFKDFELGETKQLMELFPKHKELVYKFTNSNF